MDDKIAIVSSNAFTLRLVSFSISEFGTHTHSTACWLSARKLPATIGPIFGADLSLSYACVGIGGEC